MPLTDRKYTIALAYASGTADRTGAVLDMSGFQEVDIIVSLGAVEAGGTNSIKAQSDADSAFGSPQDITGTAQTIADDDDSQVFIIHVANPPERYVRVYVDKDTSHALAESAMYVQHKPSVKPITNAVTDAITTESHVWPAVGTA
jgi:hypothetical protein